MVSHALVGVTAYYVLVELPVIITRNKQQLNWSIVQTTDMHNTLKQQQQQAHEQPVKRAIANSL